MRYACGFLAHALFLFFLTISFSFNQASAQVVRVCTAEIIRPFEGETVTGVFEPLVEARNCGDIEVTFGLLGGPDSYGYSGTIFDTSIMPSGDYQLTARVQFNLFNSSQTLSRMIRIKGDEQAPLVNIISPTTGSDVEGTVSFAVQASDKNGIQKVEFFANGELFASDTKAPFETLIDTRGLTEDATVLLKAIAYDSYGNQAAEQVSVRIDNINDPPVPNLALRSGQQVSGSFALQANATDDDGIRNVKFYIDGALIATDLTAPYRTVVDTTHYPNGLHQIAAIATDITGLVTTEVVQVKVANGDDTAPIVSFSSHQTGDTLSGIETLQVVAKDENGIRQATFYIEDQEIGFVDTLPLRAVIDTTQYVDGVYTLSVVVVDGSGNVGSDKITVALFNEDTTDTAAYIATPVDNEVVSGIIRVEVIAFDNIAVHDVTLFVDGKEFRTDSVSPYFFTLDTSAFANGSHTLTALATDFAGNSNQDTIQIKISNDGTEESLSPGEDADNNDAAAANGLAVKMQELLAALQARGGDSSTLQDEEVRQSLSSLADLLLGVLTEYSSSMSSAQNERQLMKAGKRAQKRIRRTLRTKRQKKLKKRRRKAIRMLRRLQELLGNL